MWKKVSSKEIFSHPRLTLLEDEVILPNGHHTSYLKFKDNGSCAATIIAKNQEGLILLQTEYSYPPNQILIQFPGGYVSANEQPVDGANRELMEEAGYQAQNMELLGKYLINNRRSAVQMYVYLATDLKESSLPADLEEDIKSFWYTESQIDQKIRNGEIINSHALSSWALYKAKYPNN